MIFRPAEHGGPVLTGRSRAATLRAEIERAAADEQVVVDLAGVELISPSFADELFGKLADQAKLGSVRFVHVPRDIKPLVRFVVEGRRGSPA